jgi:uncharacterized protein (TIGR00730 family)
LYNIVQKGNSMTSISSIWVLAGSADHLRPDFYAAAQHMGRLLAEEHITLVYGAGKTGLMGAVAEGALKAGGEVVGVTPVQLNTPVLIHQGLTRLEVTENMHTRKARLQSLADAVVALPGGLGTFEELFEALTWAQLGLRRKPVGVLNTVGYYTPLLDLVGHAIKAGFIYPEHERLLLSDEEPAGLLSKLRTFVPPTGLERWVTREP